MVRRRSKPSQKSGNHPLNPRDEMAIVREVDGQMVLYDPVGVAVITAVAKQNCQNTLVVNKDRVNHFKRRVSELGKTAEEVVIVLLNVDDGNGAELADILMPGYNWQEIRDRGETPFARGLAKRNGIQEALALIDKSAAAKLSDMNGLAVVVVDNGVAEVFPA